MKLFVCCVKFFEHGCWIDEFTRKHNFQSTIDVVWLIKMGQSKSSTITSSLEYLQFFQTYDK